MARYTVIEKSFIDNRIVEAGEVVDIELGIPYEPRLHPNLEPETPPDDGAAKPARAPKS